MITRRAHADIVRIDAAELDLHRPLDTFGLDSLNSLIPARSFGSRG
ncbi:hypothetical protein [Streptomyces sp. NPDC020607]